MNDKRLLKCPFCGGEAEFHRTPVKTNGGWCDSVVVRCKKCEARTNRILYDARKHQNDSEYEEAAAAWNNRKPVENVLKLIESEILEKLSDCGDYWYTAEKVNEAIEIIKESIELIEGVDFI